MKKKPIIKARSRSVTRHPVGAIRGGGQVCTICYHPKQHEINARLVSRSGSLRNIAIEYGVGYGSLERHKQRHLPALYEAMRQSMVIVEARSTLEEIRSAAARCLAIADKAEATDQLSVAVQALRALRENHELICRLTGELSPHGQASGPVEITVNWVTRPLPPPEPAALEDGRTIDVGKEENNT